MICSEEGEGDDNQNEGHGPVGNENQNGDHGLAANANLQNGMLKFIH